MDAIKKTRVPGILLFHEDNLSPAASTIAEHLGSFQRYSQFPIFPVNLHFGFPPQLFDYQFAALVFHYALSPTIHWLTPEFEAYVRSCKETHKVAIFQDELWFFEKRFSFLRRCEIDCLYSRHKPHHVREIYPPDLPIKDYVYYLAGYVADDLVTRGAAGNVPFEERPIDVGYRGRQLPFYMGRGSQEKAEIGRRFTELAAGRGLKLDIALEEHSRLYGDQWDRFLASCKAVLGVEGGVSVIDREGTFCRRSEQILKENPNLTFDEFTRQMGPDFAAQEDKIYYRSITPRHFEAAAFRCLQILFEGEYDGLMKPGVHYVSLRKDFSNLDEVLQTLADRNRCQAIINQAHQDLIASGQYTYAQFIQEFDQRLIAAGVDPHPTAPEFHRNLQRFLNVWIARNVRARDDRERVAQDVHVENPPSELKPSLFRRVRHVCNRWRLRMSEILLRRTVL